MRREAVILPELGIPADEPIVVSHWYAAKGEAVLEGDRLVELVAGPTSFDVSAPANGRLAEIRADEDSCVAPGAVLGLLAVEDGDGDEAD